jgi:hypothetical protein
MRLSLTERTRNPRQRHDVRRVIETDEVEHAFGEAYSLARHSPSFLRSLGWYRKGLTTEDPLDRFLAFWNAIEIVASKYFHYVLSIDQERAKKGSKNQVWACFEALWGPCGDWPVITGQDNWIDESYAVRLDVAHGMTFINIHKVGEVAERLPMIEDICYQFLNGWRERFLDLPRQTPVESLPDTLRDLLPERHARRLTIGCRRVVVEGGCEKRGGCPFVTSHEPVHRGVLEVAMSQRTAIALGSLVVLLVATVALARWWPTAPPQPPGPEGPAGVPTTIVAANVQVSGPYAHGNLTLFLIHGADQLQGKSFLTLDEALAQKKFIIHETQSVNELAMENLSTSEEVLILSGDILKGGQQDRISQYDVVIAPQSGRIPLAAFCVEHTAPRWMREKTVQDGIFSASPGAVSSNSTRLASRYYSDQGRVWTSVAESQANLSANVGVSVKSAESDSSLALSLSAKEVQEAADKHVAVLEKIVEGKNDVIGMAFAINGKMVAADVFGSGELFRKVWPKLLRASAVEAVAELQKDKTFEPVGVEVAKVFLEETEQGKAIRQETAKGMHQNRSEAPSSILFETIDHRDGLVMIRRNYCAR